MEAYLSSFISSPQQVLAVLAVGVVWFAFSALGRPFTRGANERVFAPIIGWAVVVTVYTILGTISVIPFTVIGMALAALAVGITLFYWNKDGGLFDPIWLRMVAIAGPLMLALSGMQGSQWDEFSHWLTGQEYLLRFDAFPGEGRPPSSASFPAYPYGWIIPSYLVSRVAGYHVENASALLNILLLLSLGRAALDMAARGCGVRLANLWVGPWVIAGLGALCVTLIYPTFVQKVIFTAYADLATSVALAMAVILGVQALERVRDGLDKDGLRLLLMSGLALSTLVTLKQSTLELYLLGFIGLGVFALISGIRAIRELSISAAIIALPGFALYMIWRIYVEANLPGKEFTIRPFNEWFFHLAPGLIVLMLSILLQKGYYLFAMMLGVIGGLRSFWQPTLYNRTMAVIGLIFIGHVVFLFICYLAIFGSFEAERAASFWRYNQQLGGLAALAIAMTGAHVLVWLDDRIAVRRLSYLPIIAIVIVPLALPDKIRFDREPHYIHYRSVGAAVAEYVGKGSTVLVFDPRGSGESGVMTKHETADKETTVRYLAAFQDQSKQAQARFFESVRGNWLLIHSINVNTPKIAGIQVDDRTSYLIRFSEDGLPQLHDSWQWPAGMNF